MFRRPIGSLHWMPGCDEWRCVGGLASAAMQSLRRYPLPSIALTYLHCKIIKSNLMPVKSCYLAGGVCGVVKLSVHGPDRDNTRDHTPLLTQLVPLTPAHELGSSLRASFPLTFPSNRYR